MSCTRDKVDCWLLTFRKVDSWKDHGYTCNCHNITLIVVVTFRNNVACWEYRNVFVNVFTFVTVFL